MKFLTGVRVVKKDGATSRGRGEAKKSAFSADLGLANQAKLHYHVTMGSHFVLYDSECSFCAFQMKVLRWLDWRNLFVLVPASDVANLATLAPELAPSLVRITPSELNEAIHCVTETGAIHQGARAIRFISARLPLLVPLALALWFPGVISVAARIYAVISRNRQTISRLFGCKDACALLPDRPNGSVPQRHSL
jgi:predicted DCC family thiol-disulfide oxidoreductase YuxK